jgi:hypothetical protein
MFPQPVVAPPGMAQPGLPQLAIPAQKRRRTVENIIQDRDSKIEIIRMLQKERKGLIEAMERSRNERETDEIQNRLKENDQQLELLEKEMEDDERRVKRKVAKMLQR